MMRIIAGTAKGRRLTAFKGRSIRPTTDMVREAIFNILPTIFPHTLCPKVLDLFAGTGAMGIEALSRGAAKVLFIDNDPQAVRIIKKNLELCRFVDKAQIMTMEVLSSLSLIAKRGEKFDLIFIDPPYETAILGDVLNCIADKGILKTDGIIAAESSKRKILDAEVKGLKLFDRRRYGDTVVSFYKNSGGALSSGGIAH